MFLPGGIMISIETMRHHTEQMLGAEFPLVFWRGKGRIVGSDEGGLSLLVRGMRADYTWDRLTVTWKRFLSNHTLTVDELGGGERVVGQEAFPGDGEPVPGVVGPHAADEQGQATLVRPHDATLAAPEHERELCAEHLLGVVPHRLDGDHDASREEHCSG